MINIKTKTQFDKMILAGEMLEYADVFGHKYGTPKAPVENALSKGLDVLFDVDWQGSIKIRNYWLMHFNVPMLIPGISIFYSS